MKTVRVSKTGNPVAVSIVISTMPALAWSHPGHGLDGLWAHDMVHTATAVLAIALVVTVAVRLGRNRRQKKRG